MSDETKTEEIKPPAARQDPFKPVQPAIPGVPAESAEKKAVPPPPPPPPKPVARPVTPKATVPAPHPGSAPAPKKGLAIGASVGIVVVLAGLIAYTKMQQPAASSPASAATSEPSAAAELAPATADNLPVGPGVVAKADDLAKPWASKKFIFNDPVGGTSVPAMVVRLPRGGYWGFSLKEPFGSCDLEFVTDMQRLQDFYGYHADHPMVGDPCNKAVFDLLQYGGPSNAEVRGMPVHGMGVRPPIAIEIEQKGDDVSAVRME